MENAYNLPYFVKGEVVKGFGRGSKQLGIPTANFSNDVVSSIPESLLCGVYYGWANVDHGTVYPMVLSVGWNPFYKNSIRTMEVHIMKRLDDFYGSLMKVVVMGYIRPMTDFSSVDELITTIHQDMKVASIKLNDPNCQELKQNKFFQTPS